MPATQPRLPPTSWPLLPPASKFPLRPPTTMDWSLILEIFGFAIGLIYLWWEYHADARVWLASMIMPAISMWIYLSKGIYADFAINIYYLIIAIYGWIAWTRRKHKTDNTSTPDEKHGDTLPVSHTPVRGWIVVIISTSGLWILLTYILSTFTDSKVPVTDAFTTALSIVAMWMMARKWAEQWLAWMVVDIVCVALYIYKGLIFYPVLYAIYTVIAILGYRKWLRLIPQHSSQDTNLP